MSFNCLMNNIADIEQVSLAQNAVSKQKIETWTIKYKNVKCRIDEARGNEYQGTVKDIGKADMVMYLPKKYIVDNVKNRVKYNSKTYNILICSNAGGHFHHWEIYLQEKI